MIALKRDFACAREHCSWKAQKDFESLRTMCWSVLLRTLRDLYTYQDCSRQHRKNLYDTSFNWIFRVSPDDDDQPMSFVWVCGILELDHDQVARTVWGLRDEGFRALKAALVTVREKPRELQR